MFETLVSGLSMTSGVQRQDTSFRKRLFDVRRADGEGEAGGAGTVVGDEERPLGARRREVDVVDELGIWGEALEVELLEEEVAPREGIEGPIAAGLKSGGKDIG